MAKKKTKKIGMEDFFIAEKSEEGIKFPLILPSTGELTDHYITVRGRYSDVVIDATNEGKRGLINSIGAKGADSEAILRDYELKIRVACVAGWSFDEECNIENVTRYLKGAKQVASAIDKIAADASNFVKKK